MQHEDPVARGLVLEILSTFVDILPASHSTDGRNVIPAAVAAAVT